MAQQSINLGSAANDGTGDTPRAAGAKINAMTTELYRNLPAAGLQRSVGERLRRARANALLTSALVTTPLIIPSLILDNTLYQRGQLGLAGNNIYVCLGGTIAATISGTTGAGTRPSGVATIVQTDGTATWAYYGQLMSAANDAFAPTLTTTTNPNANATFTALTAIAYLTPSTTLLKYLGTIPGATGFQAPTGGSNKTYPPASMYKTINNTTTPIANGGLVQWESDAPKIAVNVGASTTSAFNFRIMVDQFDGKGWRYLQQSPFVVPAGLGDPQFGVLIDWSTVGGRKARAYRVETDRNVGLNSLRMMPNDDLWLTPAVDDVRAYWLSDSWGEGVAGNILGGGNQIACMGMGWQALKRLGLSNVQMDVAGGTGYVATNSSAANNYQTRTSLNQASLALADIVFIDEAVINDSGSGGAGSAANEQAAVATTIANIRAANAFCPIVIFGAGITTTSTQTSLLGYDNAVAAAVAAMQTAGDANIWFLSRINDPQGPWSKGTGKSSVPNGDGNSDFFTTSDGAHRTDFGLEYEGRRLADAFSHYVLPYIP